MFYLISLILNLFLILASAGCGPTSPFTNLSEPKIAHGRELKPVDYGYHSVVKILYPSGISCTGTLIAPKAILTAAHCIKNEPAEVLFQSPDPASDQLLSIMASGGIQHPGYRSQTSPQNPDYGVDIGILQLAYAAPSHALPAQLPSSRLDSLSGENLAGIGFGVTENGDSVTRPHIGFFRTFRQIDFFSRVHLIQFENSQSSPRSCVGDSGGPLIDLDTHTVVGVDSFGTSTDLANPDNCNDDLNFNYVFIPKYLDFIKEHAQGLRNSETLTPEHSLTGQLQNCFEQAGATPKKMFCFFMGSSGQRFVMLQSVPVAHSHQPADVIPIRRVEGHLQSFFNFIVNRPSFYKGEQLRIINGEPSVIKIEARTAWDSQGNPVAQLLRNSVTLIETATLQWPALTPEVWDEFKPYAGVIDSLKKKLWIPLSHRYLMGRAMGLECHIFKPRDADTWFLGITKQNSSTLADARGDGVAEDIVALTRQTAQGALPLGLTELFSGSALKRKGSKIYEDFYEVRLNPPERGIRLMEVIKNGRIIVHTTVADVLP